MEFRFRQSQFLVLYKQVTWPEPYSLHLQNGDNPVCSKGYRRILLTRPYGRCKVSISLLPSYSTFGNVRGGDMNVLKCLLKKIKPFKKKKMVSVGTSDRVTSISDRRGPNFWSPHSSPRLSGTVWRSEDKRLQGAVGAKDRSTVVPWAPPQMGSAAAAGDSGRQSGPSVSRHRKPPDWGALPWCSELPNVLRPGPLTQHRKRHYSKVQF